MPTHQVLSSAQRAQFVAIPDAIGERDMARYYTLGPARMTLVRGGARTLRIGMRLNMGVRPQR